MCISVLLLLCPFFLCAWMHSLCHLPVPVVVRFTFTFLFSGRWEESINLRILNLQRLLIQEISAHLLALQLLELLWLLGLILLANSFYDANPIIFIFVCTLNSLGRIVSWFGADKLQKNSLSSLLWDDHRQLLLVRTRFDSSFLTINATYLSSICHDNSTSVSY